MRVFTRPWGEQRDAPTIVLMSVLMSVLMLVSFSLQAQDRQVLDRIAAVIESEIITIRDLEAKAGPYMKQLEEISDSELKAKRRHEILQQVLDIEIGERIVTREIERNRDKLSVTEKEVDDAVEQVLDMNNLTRDQLQAALYGQGLTWSEYRKKLRTQLERTKLIQYKVQGRIQVKEGDVKRRCEERQRLGTKNEQVCASHILFKIPDGSSLEEQERLRHRASQLQAELASGADFSAFALKYSDDKSAPNGDIGCFARGEMVNAFERAAFKMKVGDVSPVVKTEYGYHIIKVTDRRSPSVASCEAEAALGPFRNEIYQEEMERQMNVWISELRSKSFVEVRL